MLFSVIIPAYNAETTLYACLESVQNQTCSDFEVIMVDDGSRDNTTQIMEEFCAKDVRFKKVYQQNKGVSSARNNGIDKASGDYLVFLDSDDRYETGYLHAFQKMIQLFPEYDHYWCNYFWVTSQKEEISNEKNESIQESICILNRAEIMTLHERVLDAALWNKAYKRSIVEKYGIRMRRDISLGEDLLFNYQYLDVTRPEILMNQSSMYAYTSAENGTLNSKYRDDLEQIYDLLDEKILYYLQKWQVSQEQMTKYYNSVFYGLERVLFNVFREENTQPYFEKLRKNTRILFSKKFRAALKRSNCFIHPLFRVGYTIGCWPVIQILNKLAETKQGHKQRNM